MFFIEKLSPCNSNRTVFDSSILKLYLFENSILLVPIKIAKLFLFSKSSDKILVSP